MIRLLLQPALLTSLVVAASVTSGLAFGVAAMCTALALRDVARTSGERLS